MSTLNYPHAGKGMSRVGTSGLRIRTHNFTDVSSSNFKAKGIASADWRKSTSTASSSGSILEKTVSSKRKLEARSSADMPSPFPVEMDDMAHRNVRHRPRSERAAWEMVLSAPGGMFPGSSISSGQYVTESISVNIKSARAMTMNVNGEDIALDNSFAFDIVPVESDRSSFSDDSWSAIGELKRIDSRSSHHRKLSRSQDASDLPSGLQRMLDGAQLSLDQSRISPHRKSGQASVERTIPPRQTGLGNSTNRGPSGPMTARNIPSFLPRARVSVVEEDTWRYQSMLSRLNKQPGSIDVTERHVRDIKAVDPSIVTAKIKDMEIRSEDSSSTGPGPEKFQIVLHPKSGLPRRARKDSSLESDMTNLSGRSLVGSSCSGISTAETLFSGESGSSNNRTTVLHPIGESTGGEYLDSPTKRLNPAAAEFKSTFAEKAFSPKKMTRTPLTNLFPEATQKGTTHYNDTGAEGKDFKASQVLDGLPPQVPQVPGLALPYPDELPLSYNTLSPTHRNPGLRPPPGFGFVDKAYTTVPNSAYQHIVPPLPPVPMNSPLLGSIFDMYPAPAFIPPPPVSIAQMHMANMSGFGTYPGTALPATRPLLAPGVSHDGRNAVHFSSTVSNGPAPCPPLFGADRKINRPNFPVTQKPRDHDPIKQQQYEAYLEWRKANEPGYHMRCKMRQAQRVARQSQHQNPDRSGNPAQKSIAEKAKADVGAKAEAVAAEKRAREESVRAELKAKVRERSEESMKSENIRPPKETSAV